MAGEAATMYFAGKDSLLSLIFGIISIKKICAVDKKQIWLWEKSFPKDIDSIGIAGNEMQSKDSEEEEEAEKLWESKTARSY